MRPEAKRSEVCEKSEAPAVRQPGLGGSTLPRETVVWVLTWACSLLVAALSFKLIQAYYHPDIARLLEYAKSVSAMPGGFLPEPRERLLYVSGVCAFFFGSLFFYRWIAAGVQKLGPRWIAPLYGLALAGSGAALLFVTLKGLAAENPCAAAAPSTHDLVGKTNADFYFTTTFLAEHFWLYTGVLFPLIALGFYWADKRPSGSKSVLGRVSAGGVALFCGLLILAVFWIASFPFPYTYENKYDFNAVFYSVVQVCGGAPMLVDHFTNTYGLYPHFIAPVLNVTGLSVASFTAVMALLLCLCFAALLLFLRQVVHSQALLLFGFTTVFFNGYLYGKIAESYDAYYAMHPIRWLFPMLLLAHSQLYLKRPSRPLYCSSLVLFAAGILWNPDFGLATFFALLAFYSYLELRTRSVLALCGKVLLHGVCGAAAVAATFGGYALAIRWGYGAFPDLGSLFSTLKVFSLIGFNMLPMPSTYHPWMLVAAAYSFGLLYAIRAAVRSAITPRSATVFLVTILGLAQFSYYLGRSHNWNLFISNPMAFVLLTLFADDLLRLCRRSRTLFIPFAALLYLLAFSLFQTLAAYPRMRALFSERQNERENKDEEKMIRENAAFIKSGTRRNEKVFILTARQYPGLYHCLSETVSAFNPGLMDLMLKSDVIRLLDFLRDNESVPIFFEPVALGGTDTVIAQALAALYEVREVSANRAVMRLEKKPSAPHAPRLPEQSGSAPPR